MKKKKVINFLLIIIAIIFLISLILFYVEKHGVQTVSQNDNENINDTDKYDDEINKLAVSEMRNEQEVTMISIVENGAKMEENMINITDKDIAFLEALDRTREDAKETAIENKIYANEAQKMGIILPQDKIEEIERISNSDEILSYVQKEDMAQDRLKKRIETYLIENSYYKALKDKILDEVTTNNISIENQMISSKTKEYNDIQENFKKIENPTEEDRQNCLNKTLSLYYEIEDLYLNAIKDKYIIDIK